MKTERVKTADISHDPGNTRTHDARNIESIAASLRRFGQQKPIVVNADGVVIAGNGTLAAARKLGWAEVDVVRTGLEGVDAIAYAIADNRTAELAEWDDDALAKTLAALKNDESIDEQVTGFSLSDIGEIVEKIEREVEEGKPEVTFSEWIGESNNYVVLIFNNDIDWLSAQTHFDLKPAYAMRQNGEPWSKGIGRVIDGAKYLTRITRGLVG